MIINDTHNFVFIHIPKCGGSAVRSRLQEFNEIEGKYSKDVHSHPDLGAIDYGHIPLSILRKYFPGDYEKVRSYCAFSIIRNPFSRFASSVSQHLKMYGPAPMPELTKRHWRDAIDTVISFLEIHSEKDIYLPYQYIHFQRQVDYIYDGGDRLVQMIYDVREVDALVAEIESRFGIRAETPKQPEWSQQNETLIYRNAAVRSLVRVAVPALRLLVPRHRRQKIENRIKTLLFIPRNRRLGMLFESREVREFIGWYYKQDIALYEAVRAGHLRHKDQSL